MKLEHNPVGRTGLASWCMSCTLQATMWLQSTACLSSLWRLQVLERYNAQIESRSALLELVPPGKPATQLDAVADNCAAQALKLAPDLMTCLLWAARGTCLQFARLMLLDWAVLQPKV